MPTQSQGAGTKIGLEAKLRHCNLQVFTSDPRPKKLKDGELLFHWLRGANIPLAQVPSHRSMKVNSEDCLKFLECAAMQKALLGSA